MKFLKLFVFSCIFLQITSCGGSGGDSGNSDGLTGVWRSEFNNGLYLLNENGSSVSVNVCNSEEPFTLIQSNGYLVLGGANVFKINNASELEIPVGILIGTKLNKISDNSSFDSGSVSIQSSNIADLSTSENVCAYRQADEIFTKLAAPYEGGYLEVDLDVNNKAPGNFIIPTDVSISFESPQSPGITIRANTGSVNVIEYSGNKIVANYQFTAVDGNEYTGSIDVDL